MDKTTIHCVAIDDEPYALSNIQHFCSRIEGIHLTCFNSSLDGYEYLKTHTPDILFLDIVMPDLSGIEIAKLVKELPYIIFTTAHKQYAIESYDYNTVDYLLKPYNFERFNKAFQKAKALLELRKQPDEVLVIMAEYQKIPIRTSEILYIESSGNYVKIFTPHKTYMTQSSLKSICDSLNPQKFKRVHRAFVVNLAEITSYTKKSITIGETQIPIGKNSGFQLDEIM